jgi:diadenylate cyclase
MAARRSKQLLDTLAKVAPGQPLRDGVDRIINAKMGALIVVGNGPEVLNICSGGFLLDAAYTPQRLSELAKTDGAIILADDASSISRANVHLVPNPNTPTTETGTRHRTAERVARSIGVPVISISERMAVVTVYINDHKHQLDPIPAILTRSNQALQTLERYKHRLTEVSAHLSTAEVEDVVTIADVVTLLQQTEVVVRVADEIGRYLIELGTDGRLIRLQLQELMVGVEDDRRLVVLDYFQPDSSWDLERAMATLSDLELEHLLNAERVADALHLTGNHGDADSTLSPRGYRMLSKVPRLPREMVARIVERFLTLDRILRAKVPELMEVEGIDETLARTIKETLSRIAESSILDRYS